MLSKLLKSPPWVWGSLYLLAIPIFAGIFLLNSSGFYHSTISKEGLTDKYNSSLSNMLSNEFEKISEQSLKSKNDYLVDNYFSLRNLEITHNSLIGELSFDVSVAIEGLSFKNEQVIELSKENKSGKDVLIKFRSIYIGYDFMKGMHTNNVSTMGQEIEVYAKEFTLFDGIKVGHGLKKINLDSQEKVKLLRYIFGDQLISKKSDIVIHLLPNLERIISLLKSYEQVSKNLPQNSLEGFATMLYFSTVTITTLGYGDILPISTKARMLVAAESILGVVLIGLFFFSLSNRIGRKENESGSTWKPSRLQKKRNRY